MKEELQETELKLSKSQIQNVITNYVKENDGLNQLFEMLLNGLMHSERQVFLSENEINGNKGNGFREATRSGIGNKLELRIPRDRLGVFKPVVLGLLNQQEEQIKSLCFELYGKGLTTRQIEGVVENIYGTSYSKSSISRITTDFTSLVNAWLNRSLESHYHVIYIDAIHIKVRRDKTVATEAFYIMLGLKEDYTREVLSIVNIPQESASGWQQVLEEIKARGVDKVDLFVFDGLTGLGAVVGKVFTKAQQQRCMLHFQRNLHKNVRKTDRDEFSSDLSSIFRPDQQSYTPEQAMDNLHEFIEKWQHKYTRLKALLIPGEYENLFTYLRFDYRIRRMIYTTNWIERLNKSFRRTLKMRNALPSSQAAITLLAYTAMEMEDGTYSYPITNFNFEPKFAKLNA